VTLLFIIPPTADAVVSNWAGQSEYYCNLAPQLRFQIKSEYGKVEAVVQHGANCNQRKKKNPKN
jgi:hypothetical protein